jgi:tetratricopeptide (TPR) repeat protein
MAATAPAAACAEPPAAEDCMTPEGGDPATWFQVSAMHLAQSDPETAIIAYECAALADPADAQSLVEAGALHYGLDRLDEAEETTRRALAAADAAGDVVVQSRALHNLGTIAAARGDDPGSDDFVAQAVARLEGQDQPQALGELFLNMAASADNRGDAPEAVRRLEAAGEQFRLAGDRGGFSRSINYLGVIDARSGSAAPAATRFAEALAIAEEIGDIALQFDIQNNIAVLAQSNGDMPKLCEALDRAATLADEAGDATTAAAVRAGMASEGCAPAAPSSP